MGCQLYLLFFRSFFSVKDVVPRNVLHLLGLHFVRSVRLVWTPFALMSKVQTEIKKLQRGQRPGQRSRCALPRCAIYFPVSHTLRPVASGDHWPELRAIRGAIHRGDRYGGCTESAPVLSATRRAAAAVVDPAGQRPALSIRFSGGHRGQHCGHNDHCASAAVHIVDSTTHDAHHARHHARYARAIPCPAE